MSLESKSETRKRIKTQLANLTTEIKNKNSEDVSLNILRFLKEILPTKFPHYSSDGIIGGFAPMFDEVNWLQGLERLFDQLAFPGTCDKGDMIFLKTSPTDLIESTIFGVVIKSPPVEAMIVVPDLLLIPGLAFDSNGKRLGRGRGYYDKYLKNFKGLKIGICNNEQLIEEVPVEVHDVTMDGLITNKEILLF